MQHLPPASSSAIHHFYRRPSTGSAAHGSENTFSAVDTSCSSAAGHGHRRCIFQDSTRERGQVCQGQDLQEASPKDHQISGSRRERNHQGRRHYHHGALTPIQSAQALRCGQGPPEVHSLSQTGVCPSLPTTCEICAVYLACDFWHNPHS